MLTTGTHLPEKRILIWKIGFLVHIADYLAVWLAVFNPEKQEKETETKYFQFLIQSQQHTMDSFFSIAVHTFLQKLTD